MQGQHTFAGPGPVSSGCGLLRTSRDSESWLTLIQLSGSEYRLNVYCRMPGTTKTGSMARECLAPSYSSQTTWGMFSCWSHTSTWKHSCNPSPLLCFLKQDWTRRKAWRRQTQSVTDSHCLPFPDARSCRSCRLQKPLTQTTWRDWIIQHLQQTLNLKVSDEIFYPLLLNGGPWLFRKSIEGFELLGQRSGAARADLTGQCKHMEFQSRWHLLL